MDLGSKGSFRSVTTAVPTLAPVRVCAHAFLVFAFVWREASVRNVAQDCDLKTLLFVLGFLGFVY